MQRSTVPSLTGTFRLRLSRKNPLMLSSMTQCQGAPAALACAQAKLRAGPGPRLLLSPSASQVS